jgi:hypothetical protein
MNRESFEQLIETLLEHKPFQVFTIELNGGKRFEVDHARAFTMRDGVAHYLAPGGMPIWFPYESVSHVFPAGAAMPTGSNSAPFA